MSDGHRPRRRAPSRRRRRGPPGALLAAPGAGSSTSIGLILLGLIVVFSLLDPSAFVDVANARNIATDAAVLLVLAVGMTFVIITAGIDLSVGGVLVFRGVVSAKGMHAAGGDSWGVIVLGLVAALAGGVAWGLLNGLLVAKAQDPALDRHARHAWAWRSARRSSSPAASTSARSRSSSSTTIGTGRVFGQVPWLVLIASRSAIVFGIVLAATRFGRYTYAVGSNEEAARRAGVPVDRHLMKVYALAGTLAGLAGFLSLARFSTTTIGGHDTDNLQSIAAVVIGGTSLFGGIGTMLGTVFGVFIPAVLQNGFVIVGVKPFWQRSPSARC